MKKLTLCSSFNMSLWWQLSIVLKPYKMSIRIKSITLEQKILALQLNIILELLRS